MSDNAKSDSQTQQTETNAARAQAYDWVLFDADETLFSFDSAAGLQRLFASYEVDFDEAALAEFYALNRPLWDQYQSHQITAQDLRDRRFTAWAERLQVTTHELNVGFLEAMSDVSVPLLGAKSLLDALKQANKSVAIITNGFNELQAARLEKTGFGPYFDFVLTSEQVGISKPHGDIFDAALKQMQNPDRQRVLMVGDNPKTDILGGMRAGMDTAWFNAAGTPTPDDIQPTLTFQSLPELQRWLFD